MIDGNRFYRILGLFIIPVFVVFFIAAYVFADDEKRAPLPQPPNIIILFADDMGYGDAGVYGHPTIRTPNLDRMAAEGMKFTSFYAASPACTASRYSLLTGRYPVLSGFRWVLRPDSERGLHPEEITIAKALKSKGYATGIYGKWHLGTADLAYLPLQHGFDEYIGLPYSNDMLPPGWPDIPFIAGNDTIDFNPDQSKLTELYTEKAIEFIRQHKDQPFFVYVPYAMPHVPLYPGSRFQGTSRRGVYGDVIEELDWSAGRFMDVLKEEGLAENTLLFFTSDNGPWIIKDEEGGSSGLLRDGKGSTWEGGMRVPALAWWPGSIPEGSINYFQTSTLDLFTTSLGLAGAEIPTDRIIDGRDIRPYLFDENPEMVEEKPFFYYGSPENVIFAVRKGPWKLHVQTYSQTGIDYFDGELPLLFHLDHDPSEQYNLASEFPEIIEELKNEIERQKRRVEIQPDFFTLEEQ